MIPGADDSPQQSSGQRHQLGAADRSVSSSIASPRVVGREAGRRHHVSWHRPVQGHGRRASPHGDAPARKRQHGWGRLARSTDEKSQLPARGSRGWHPGEDRYRSFPRPLASVPTEARAEVRPHRGGGSADALLPECLSGSHDRPSVRKRSGGRPLPLPKAPAARWLGRMNQPPAARRSVVRRLRTYRDRVRKVRPQWDHLPANGCFDI